MNVEIITKEDLQIFRLQLINDIKELLLTRQEPATKWLRSVEVRKQLKISAGTLQNFRITGKLKSSKIGGIHFYRNTDVDKLLEGKP